MSKSNYRHLLENKYKFDLPNALENNVTGADMIDLINVFAIIIIIKLIVIGMIVSHSLISNLINSLEYETAMLRCLGWTHSHVCLSILIRQVLFISIPGMVSGLMAIQGMYKLLNYVFIEKANTKLNLELTSFQIFVAIFIAIGCPIISLIPPMLKASKQVLRDMLN